MTCDGAVDGGDAQLFPEEWRDRLDEKLTDGIVIPCPHCSGNAPAGSPPVEPITFILDEPSDAAERQRAVDSLLASGTYVTMLLDEECAVAEKRKEPFFVVLSLEDDGEIHVKTLNRKGMAELHVSSARAAATAGRSIAKISEAAAADVRTVFYHILTGSFDVPEDDLDGVPDAELMRISEDVFNARECEGLACANENDETGKRLIKLLGDRATADDRDPNKTSPQELVDKVWAVHNEFVEAIATAIGVNLTQDAAADVRAIFERLQDLASNNPNTIIEIGVALGMDEGEMRRKMLATPAAATGDEKVAWAELAKSVMDTAKVMLARFMYACEAAGLDKQTRDGDPITAMRALSAIIGENRRVAAVREGGAQGRGR